MKLIIGLGNPGKKYAESRHNAGFLALDFLQQLWGFEPFKPNEKMAAAISKGAIAGEKILLIKPTTFMNDSGSTVSRLLQFYKFTPADVVVIHDDLDITPGTFRTTLSSRPAGHNGVADIIEKLGTQDFYRIRLGIGRPVEVSGVCMPTHDFVLENFSEEEIENLLALFPQMKDEVLRWVQH